MLATNCSVPTTLALSSPRNECDAAHTLQLQVALTQLLRLLATEQPRNPAMRCGLFGGSAQCTMQVVAPRPQLPLKPKSKSVSHLPAVVDCPPRKSFLYTRLSHISATRELIRSRQEAKKVVSVPGLTGITVARSEA